MHSTSADAPAEQYMPALDGLRAIAVMSVVAFHAAALRGGWLGVEVFFVLSGYLITTLMLGEVQRRGNIGLRAFWGRRVRRLWPAICVYLLITLVVIVPRFTVVTPPTTRHLVATLTWRQNWQMIGDGGYGAPLHAGVVEHFWSLSIEEQFYFVWPLLVWVTARRWGRRGVRGVAGLGAVASLVVVVWGARHGWSTDRMYLGSDTRFLGLCAGALFAGVRPVGRWMAAVAAAGAAAIIACCAWFGRIRPEILHGPLQLFTVLSVITVITSAGLRRGPLVWRPMRAIGRWSFGIYLWHVPIGMIVRAHVASQWWEAVLTALASTAVAAASYRLIERPVRTRTTTGRRIGRSLAPIAVVAALLGLIEVQPAAAGAAHGQTAQVTATASTATPSAPEPVKVTIIGDSVPAMAADELSAAGAAAGFTTTVHAADACIISTHAQDQFIPQCATWTNGLADAVAGADIVVLWWANSGALAMWYGKEYEVCSKPENTRGRLDEMVALLALPSTTEVVVGLPSARADLGVRDQQGAECQRQATIEWAAARGIPVFDPDPARNAAGSEREVRSDGLHYTPLGARAVAAALFAAVSDSDSAGAAP